MLLLMVEFCVTVGDEFIKDAKDDTVVNLKK